MSSAVTQVQQQSSLPSALERDAEVEATRNRGLLAATVDSIQRADVPQLAALQRVLQHGDTLGRWETPEAWIPPGRRQRTLVSIDLRRRIAHFLPQHLKHLASDTSHPAGSSIAERLDEAVLVLTRYLVLLRLGPVGLGRKGNLRSLDPTSVLFVGYGPGPTMLALAIASSLDGTGQPVGDNASLSSLRLGDLAHLSRNQRTDVLEECRRMRMLADRGLWADAPSLQPDSTATAMTGAPRYTEEPQKLNSHLPLPDDYVSAMGRRSLWLMRVLGPNLLAIGSAMADLWSTTSVEDWSAETIRDKRRAGISKLLSAHRWLDQEGRTFDRPPFHISLPEQSGFAISKGGGEANGDLRWPPTSYRDVMALLGTVQMAHYFIAGISIGARKSEALGLQRGCVVRSVDGRPYANGKTYKLVQRHEGEWRDWQLPEAAVDALAQQARLAEVAERIAFLTPTQTTPGATSNTGSHHLWGQVSAANQSDATKPLSDVNKALLAYARTLDLDSTPGGQTLRPHRFRKTLARLVALALTQAPKLLMEVFGHKSIEMTLYYILTDKDLRAEIETVSRELRVMRAKEVVERMVEADLASQGADSANLGGYGGLAAVSLHNAIGVHRERVHRRGDQWGANNVMELAELLTLQGKAWEQVRPGVLCTKFPGEAGPCNKSKGRPEPSKCQSTCGHRLEEAFLREDVDGSIRDALAAYETAVADEESLTAAHWAAQVRAHVPRFADLQAKWMVNPTVRALVGNENSKVTA